MDEEFLFDPTYGGYFGEVVGENVFDPNFGVTTDPVFFENDGTGTTAGGGFNNPNVGSILYENDGTASTTTGAGGVGAGNMSASASDAIKLINADTSGLLRKLFVDDKGNLNLKTLGGVGGGILGALGALSPNTKRSGYQGSIPKYEAVRNMVTAPPTKAQGYRPGQGGVNWGGDVSYVPKGSAAAAAPSSGGGSSMLGDLAKVAGVGGLGYLAGQYLTGGNSPFKGVTTDFTSKRVGDGPNTADNGMISDAQYRGPMPTMSPTEDEGNAMDRSVDWNASFAGGGLANLAKGRYLQGETDGMADKIPARIGRDQPAALSHGEFVVPADVVSHLGNGNSDAGAKKLYSMMDKIRQARTGTKKQGKQINPDKFMPGGLAQAYASGGSVKHFVTGGTTGLGSAAAAGVTGSETGPNTWAGEYMSDMLGKGQALANAPYQQYGGPLTAGSSDLQNKVFGGLQGMNFPSNLGASFSSMGAYQPPAMNMGAYQQTPIGTGNYTRPSFEQYTSTLQPGQEPAVNKNVYDAGLAGNQIYNAAQPPMMLNQGSNGFGDFGNMQATQPLGDGARAPGSMQDMLNQGSNGFGDFGGFGDGPPKQIPNTPDNLPGLNNLFNQNMQAMTGLKNQGPAQRQTYEDYISSPTQELKMPREQFEAQQDQIQKMRDQGMDMLGRGDMREIMAGLGGKPGQMPQGGLAGLAGRMQQPQPAQQPQQPQNIAQQYMNPYLQSVLQPQMEELRRQAQINNMSGLGALTKSGAFGGGRQAIMESEAARNLLQEQNKTVGAGYSNAFDKAMGQFNTEQARDLGLAKFMSDQGAQQRGIEAEGIAADKAAFEAARENPYKMLQFQQSLLNGMPISATNIDTATPSKTQEILSGIGGGVKMVGNKPEDISLKSVTDLLDKLGLSTGG
jgi:hypothetical protein